MNKLIFSIIPLIPALALAGEPSAKCLSKFNENNLKTHLVRSCNIESLDIKKSPKIKNPVVCSDGAAMYDEANDILVVANAISGNWSHGSNVHDPSAKRLTAFVDMNFQPIGVKLQYADVGFFWTTELGTFTLSCE